ncbi:hypothetical protein [Engelhardtia mirabilis]|uniref:DUF2306 domain-containing protein n=1 Tax=Engelhardtia mirabilis TaxID=2528011 RepID=A0A518BHM8_9BACT|nr:hypothetical protein Pla133_15170 [Planctomycetes bacterium Pla133]QDV00769.1 hypothetical protein Pla86_15160 [Planctomycetes bacterium Pla86]
MTRGEAWTTHLGTVVVGASGLVYAWMLYFAEPVDEFAIVNHPWQPHLLHLHVLSAPILVLAAGLLWVRHVWGRLRSGYPHRRATGVTLAAAVFPMIASGYLLQVTVEERWRSIWIWTHLVASALWLPAYLIHQLAPRGAHAGRAASDAA